MKKRRKNKMEAYHQCLPHHPPLKMDRRIEKGKRINAHHYTGRGRGERQTPPCHVITQQ
jgi:hypothetical protein